MVAAMLASVVRISAAHAWQETKEADCSLPGHSPDPSGTIMGQALLASLQQST